LIRVEPQPEPERFDQDVRQPGRSAIAELTGKPLTLQRPGPRRRKIAERPEDIPPAKLPPFWRKCLPDLHRAYRGICSYVCVYIEPVTGAGTVDHMVPKSGAVKEAYEWSNYRLACALMNARKSDVPDVLDPFEIDDGWFELDLINFQIKPNPQLDAAIRQKVLTTIERLGLDKSACRRLQARYYFDYIDQHIDLEYLDRYAPFLALELRRQDELRVSPAPPRSSMS
jgi:5-methylcytosine-specific restriction endonuclease McrA